LRGSIHSASDTDSISTTTAFTTRKPCCTQSRDRKLARSGRKARAGRSSAMVMGTILFISGQSMNGALAAAGRAHRPMFEALGYELVEVDFSQAGADASLTNALQSQSIALVFGVMGMGADFRGTTPDGKESNLWQGLRIPYISLNGDSPAYYFDRHVMPSAWHACLYYYPDHYQLRRRYPK